MRRRPGTGNHGAPSGAPHSGLSTIERSRVLGRLPTPMTVTTHVGGFPVEIGGVGPDTLFVHGGPGLNDYLAPVSDLLADVVRSHRYTMRGIAPSPLEAPFTVAQHVADAVGILDGLELERAILLGHSWGGLVAAAIALRHPGRVRAMVLIDSTGLTRTGASTSSSPTSTTRTLPRTQNGSPSWRERTTRAASRPRNRMNGDASTGATTTLTPPTRHRSSSARLARSPAPKA